MEKEIKNEQQKKELKRNNDLKMVYEVLATTQYALDCPECGNELQKNGRCTLCPECGWSSCNL